MDDDPFIEIKWVDYSAHWHCTSCGHVDDTPYVTSEFAEQAGADHSCVDQLFPEL